MKSAPPYAISSVDHALRLAAMLQLEGDMTVARAADRLGVARSTAHRLLQMLVYRDFAMQDEDRVYHAGPVLQLAQHSRSRTAQLREASLPHLERLVDQLEESCNVLIRTGTDTRFIASHECAQSLRVTSREGMVFPAHSTTGGLLLLAEMPGDELDALYDGTDDELVVGRLRPTLAKLRRQGFAVNQGQSENGVVAVGVPVRDTDGTAIAVVSTSMPSTRYDKQRLPLVVAALHKAAGGIEADLARG